MNAKPKHPVPAGTCDCHMHVYDPAYALAPTAVAAAPPGLLRDYLKVRARLGIARCRGGAADRLRGGQIPARSRQSTRWGRARAASRW